MKSTVHVFSIGPFGRAVAAHLSALRGDTVEISLDESVGIPRINVLATWRPVPMVCERLQDVTYSTGVPFIPLILDGKYLRAGPIVVPGGDTCWSCWMRRFLQHDSWREQRKAVWNYYDENPNIGPQGYLDATALIGAALLSNFIDQLDTGFPIGGQIRELDLLSREIMSRTVTGVHGCPRCGLHRPEETRSFADMQAALKHLWK